MITDKEGAIIGDEIVTGNDIDVFNPSTGEVIDSMPSLKGDDIKRAIDIASDAFHKYSELPARSRKNLLLKVSELIFNESENLAITMSKESGRPIKSSRGEILRTGDIFKFAAWEMEHVLKGEFIPLDLYDYPAGNDERIAITLREPMGVISTITPFNFPGASFAHKVATALAVGNTVVHKPTKYTPLTQIKLSKLILKAGFPKGTINVVTGDSSMIGDIIVDNDKIRLISFTGSTNVGLDLASRAVRYGKRSIMELGGSDAEIILDDADITKAVEAATFGRFDYAGQFCNSTKKIIVSKNIAGKVQKLIVEKLSKMTVGSALNDETEIGPVISPDVVKEMSIFLKDAEEHGNKIVFKKEIPGGGFFFSPTVVDINSLHSKIVEDEVFGPLLPIIKVDSDDECISIINKSKFGLDAAIFSSNFSRAYKMARKINVGTVIINDTTRLRWDNLPFGGPKFSGIGRESVSSTMEEMTEAKVISYHI